MHSRIEEHKLDRGRWSDITEGVNYTEKKRKPPKERPERKGTGDNAPTDNRIFGSEAGAAIARFILIIIGVVLIALLVKSMLGYNKVKDKKIKREREHINLQNIEENLHEADLVDYLQQAKDAGDFNLAVRLYYLSILKELSLQKNIKWKVDKTNSEYLREMRPHPHFADFRELTLIFEKCWYGDCLLDASNFAVLEPRYRNFLYLLQPAYQAATT